MSPSDYERLRAVQMAEFDRLREPVGRQAAGRGLTEERLAELLASDED